MLRDLSGVGIFMVGKNITRGSLIHCGRRYVSLYLQVSLFIVASCNRIITTVIKMCFCPPHGTAQIVHRSVWCKFRIRTIESFLFLKWYISFHMFHNCILFKAFLNVLVVNVKWCTVYFWYWIFFYNRSTHVSWDSVDEIIKTKAFCRANSI